MDHDHVEDKAHQCSGDATGHRQPQQPRECDDCTDDDRNVATGNSSEVGQTAHAHLLHEHRRHRRFVADRQTRHQCGSTGWPRRQARMQGVAHTLGRPVDHVRSIDDDHGFGGTQVGGRRDRTTRRPQDPGNEHGGSRIGNRRKAREGDRHREVNPHGLCGLTSDMAGRHGDVHDAERFTWWSADHSRHLHLRSQERS